MTGRLRAAAKEFIAGALRRRGYAIRRLQDERTSLDASEGMFRYLRSVGPMRCVIDIGANDGAFLEFLQRFFKAEQCLAFEPLPAARAELERRGIPGLTLFPYALSDRPGHASFEVNAYGPSSSLLPVAALSSTEFPQTSRIAERIEVELARLDDVVDAEALPDGVFLKMDVQGVEDRVIAGGPRVLSRADFVMVEMSFRRLYEEQSLFEEVHAPLADLGFRLAGVKNQLSAASGEPLFGHFLYRAERRAA